MNFLNIFLFLSAVKASKPIVLWPGMGYTYSDTKSVQFFQDFFEQYLPNVYIKAIKFSDSAIRDRLSGYLGNIRNHVDIVCKDLKNDDRLKNGFNAIGVSQGGLFFRAYVQTCIDGPPIHNLITFGSPHGGVSRFPYCLTNTGFLCRISSRLISKLVYSKWTQHHIIQAQFFREISKIHDYTSKSFLADINAERDDYNLEYRQRMKKLNMMIMVKYKNDSMIIPRDSAWFSTLDQNQTIIPFQRSEYLFVQDRLGLRYLLENDRLVFITEEGNHLDNFMGTLTMIIKKYLS